MDFGRNNCFRSRNPLHGNDPLQRRSFDLAASILTIPKRHETSRGHFV